MPDKAELPAKYAGLGDITNLPIDSFGHYPINRPFLADIVREFVFLGHYGRFVTILWEGRNCRLCYLPIIGLMWRLNAAKGLGWSRHRRPLFGLHLGCGCCLGHAHPKLVAAASIKIQGLAYFQLVSGAVTEKLAQGCVTLGICRSRVFWQFRGGSD